MNLLHKNKTLLKTMLIILSFLNMIYSGSILAQTNKPDVSQYASVPPTISENTPPLIMLAMSVDHQLFFKAYSDYEDVNGDGKVETSYVNDIEYAGYFDSSLCYKYLATSDRFRPSSVISHQVVAGEVIERGYCNLGNESKEWSGNFLNWATMTRIDEVRFILYGGYRWRDSGFRPSTQDSLTVLERSYLPNDAHSFAKYYNNANDLARLTPFSNLKAGNDKDPTHGITICNTTLHTGGALSQNVSDPPLARIVEGNFSLWSANERAQCLFKEELDVTNGNDPAITGIYASSTSPSFDQRVTRRDGTKDDYVVRVVACHKDFINPDHSTHVCKQYPDGNYKPIGILQNYGEEGSSLWGLMSGTYTSNKSGGVLRKNISSIENEINVDTDGTIISGISDGGIISAINTFRISNYSVLDRGEGTRLYNDSDNCRWGLSGFNNGQCTNWGNPFAEIMQECYKYFTAGSPSYSTSDASIFPDLLTINNWSDPQSNDAPCAKLNVIAFNSSSISYDDDDLSVNVDAATNLIGSNELDSGSTYFVGENGASLGTQGHQLCTAKSVNSLSDVKGTCPDSPRLGGSYKVAGLAYSAYTTDLRADLDGDQSVTTWGVELAPGIPKIEIQVPGSNSEKVVSILPACQNISLSPAGACGLVDFRIVEQGSDSDSAWGSFYVIWEDSEQGGDYDQDMSGIIKYKLETKNGLSSSLEITTDVTLESGIYQMGFGYVLGGTTDDGFHVHSGIEGYSEFECGLTSARKCEEFDSATTRTYSIGNSSAELLYPPLYYAAKWGGFTDTDDSNTPIKLSDRNNTNEWDSNGDGLPDNYILAINPVELKARLGQLVEQILERTASGTAASISAETGGGEGAIYQAVYTPRLKGDGSELATWIGGLRAYFIDQYARVRQNTEGFDFGSERAVLDSNDSVVTFEFNEQLGETHIVTYEANEDGSLGARLGEHEIFDFSRVRPLWDAQVQLGELTNIVENRVDFSSSADTGRYILTSFDRDTGNGAGMDGQIISPVYNEINPGQNAREDGLHPFVSASFSVQKNDFRYLGFGDAAEQSEIDNLVNFIRGDESISDDRNRTLVLDGVERKLILGDLIHSSPAVISKPDSRYDVLYREESYADFRIHYENRRSMVYIGANDGMLHAFNGGFFDAATNSFKLQSTNETKHPLGSELWAYVPFNALPHLQWLQDERYSHVYYVDGPVQSFDVQIFDSSDPKYPGGWGTIIVVGMRFGGGEYSLDHDGDEFTEQITTRSSYIIMDVTDPESPPNLIAEITDEDLGFTLGSVEVIKSRADGAWHIVFGSGPGGTNQQERREALVAGVSHKTAKLYSFDLNKKTLSKIDLSEINSFTGGIEVADFDSDFTDDAIYYGVTQSTAVNSSASELNYVHGGKLKRGLLEFSPDGNLVSSVADISADLLTGIDRPFSATPRAITSSNGDGWVFAGTGRFYVPDDNLDEQQQYFFGVKARDSDTALLSEKINLADLLDTSDINVFSDGRVKNEFGQPLNISVGSGVAAESTSPLSFDDVRDFVDEYARGWYFAFETPYIDPVSNLNPKTQSYTLNPWVKNTTQAILADESIIITAYEITDEVCDATGLSFLYAPHFETGIPAPFSPLGTDEDVYLINQSNNPADGNAELVLQGVVVGEGLPSVPEIVPTYSGSGTERGCYESMVQTSTGEIIETTIDCEGLEPGRQSWREVPYVW